jgi:hypothetical protein
MYISSLLDIGLEKSSVKRCQTLPIRRHQLMKLTGKRARRKIPAKRDLIGQSVALIAFKSPRNKDCCQRKIPRRWLQLAGLSQVPATNLNPSLRLS